MQISRPFTPQEQDARLRRGIFSSSPFPSLRNLVQWRKPEERGRLYAYHFRRRRHRRGGKAVYPSQHSPAPDIVSALDRTRREEPWPLAKETLGLLWDNLELAEREELPVCQDTGMACVFVELGQEVHIQGDFEQAVHEGVRRGYGEGYLRKSIVGDPLRRVNTEDNTPAAITLRLVPGDGCRITVAPKGFGSENMSRLGMLKPADGVEGVKNSWWRRCAWPAPTPVPHRAGHRHRRLL